MLLAGFASSACRASLGALTDTSGQLIAARCPMGLGAAMVFPSTLSLITNVFTGRGRARPGDRTVGGDGGHGHRARTDRRRLAARALLLVEHLLRARAGRRVTAALVAATCRHRATPTSGPDRPGFVLSTRRWRCSSTPSSRPPHTGGGAPRSVAGFALGAALLARSLRGSDAWATRCSTSACSANPRFTAASGSVTVVFFTLLGFIFLMTQYFQFFKRYAPSRRASTCSQWRCRWGLIGVGTKLAVRFGTKIVVAAGLS